MLGFKPLPSLAFGIHAFSPNWLFNYPFFPFLELALSLILESMLPCSLNQFFAYLFQINAILNWPNFSRPCLLALKARIGKACKPHIKLESKDAGKMLNLTDLLEDHDDVQNVYANFDIPDELMGETG